MRSVSVIDVLNIAERESGQPTDEFATIDLLLDLRLATAASHAAGRRDGLDAAVRELARGILTSWPDDPNGIAVIAERSVRLLSSRNHALINVAARVINLRLSEAVRVPAEMPAALDWLGGQIEVLPVQRSVRGRQTERLFGPRRLQPIEVVLSLITPIAAVADGEQSAGLRTLTGEVARGVALARRDLGGRLALRFEDPTKLLPPSERAMSDEELWQRLSSLILDEVHGVVVADVDGVAISEGGTHQRVLHRMHGGAGLVLQDPNCLRGRIAGAWAQEVGWAIRSCGDPKKACRLVRRWIVDNADELEWIARTRADLGLIYRATLEHLARFWQGSGDACRTMVSDAVGLTPSEIDRCVTDVHFLDSIAGWKLDVLRRFSTPPVRPPRARAVESAVAWETLLQAQDECDLAPAETRALRVHVESLCANSPSQPLKRPYRQVGDWIALARELGLR